MALRMTIIIARGKNCNCKNGRSPVGAGLRRGAGRHSSRARCAPASMAADYHDVFKGVEDQTRFSHVNGRPFRLGNGLCFAAPPCRRRAETLSAPMASCHCTAFLSPKSAPASSSARRAPQAKKQPQETLRLSAFYALIRKRGSRTGRIRESRTPRERSAPPCRCPPAPPDRWRPPCPCRRPHSRRRHSCRRGSPRRRA